MKTQTHLQKCLEAIKKHPMSDILIHNYESHHLLRLSNAKIEDHILCTTKQAIKLIQYSREAELVPTKGHRYHFD